MSRDYTPRPKKGIPPKKERKPIKQRSAKKLKEIEEGEGMLDFFISIWNSRKSGQLFVPREYATVEEWREHTSQYRVCCVTYMPIVNMIPANFMHVLTKNKTKWKKEPRNICMGYAFTHNIQEFGTQKQLIEHGPGGFWFLEYKQILKEEYERGK